VVEPSGARDDRYWQLPSVEDDRLAASDDAARSETRDRLRALLDDSVRRRMVSDVPLGAFLSGGIDSSVVVALMARHSTQPVKTFHIDFAEPDFSEREFARAVAERYGTEHHEIIVRPSATDVLDDLVAYFDEPFGDSSAVPTYYVSQLTRQYVTVALAGDGGDENFGGYTRYRDILARRKLPRCVRAVVGLAGRCAGACLPRRAPGRRYFRSLGMDDFEFFAVGTDELEARALLSREFLETLGDASTYGVLRPHLQRGGRLDDLAPFTRLDLERYLPDDILTKVDRMSMAHSLEVRAPLLDHRVVELAAAMPRQWKLDNGTTKAILKEAVADLLPPAVLAPRKRGFSVPMAQWLRGPLRPALEEALADRQIQSSGIFRMKELRALAEEHWSGRDRRGQLWSYLFFVRWWHQHHQGLTSRRGDSTAARTVWESVPAQP
jgi:asparagine synthase (glutamine-hydrolysing)